MKSLLNELIELFIEVCKNNLSGIYLHGSLAMNGFNKEASDVDILTVVKSSMKIKEKRMLLNGLQTLKSELPAKGIELSVITKDSIHHFDYPTPYEFHFSKEYKELDAGFDYDLAAHMMVVFHRGKCLYGMGIQNQFKPMDEKYYTDSILRDVLNAPINENPLYYTLNLCRVLAYLKEKRIMSKKEGGEWGLENLPEPHRAAVDFYLKLYTNMQTDPWLKPSNQDMIMFAAFMERAINGSGILESDKVPVFFLDR
ncbi:aminoglycoside adenylyltransferase domain-containing protein [Metabacillus hrfriensis]|uniref:DUF4111 domain-containing protein n=1 Tax=Metabacillus hrfriensis TaxID=3048891 RepID=A0ACD4R5U9_9BACI|nr:aminoglycoside adenylyltransferase domain-containing protein [Metabacillus sp. CT-WN-B3]WHZ55826.1 DUF4111 domain-containing protein [Metabacillus sp. CT-WN-B3]